LNYKRPIFIGIIQGLLDKYNMDWEDFMLEPDEFEKKLMSKVER